MSTQDDQNSKLSEDARGEFPCEGPRSLGSHSVSSLLLKPSAVHNIISFPGEGVTHVDATVDCIRELMIEGTPVGCFESHRYDQAAAQDSTVRLNVGHQSRSRVRWLAGETPLELENGYEMIDQTCSA